MKAKDKSIEDLRQKATTTLNADKVLQNLIEQFFCQASESETNEKLELANESLKSEPLIVASDIEDKNTAEHVYSVNPAPYL